ncbi:MAG: family 78 glycoside hydrolase catalytic domain [Planctomycetota bacterium]|nr:MAG: family 78 glycoside hydrolase catalytic domain [Planctomycetota bacterium]
MLTVFGYMLVSTGFAGTTSVLANKPVYLRCEYRINPLGIGTTSPRLSWELDDGRRGARQTAYQIMVSTKAMMDDPNTVVWDTGKVESDQSIHVAYAGKPLTSGKIYYWKVRTWDAVGEPTEYSEPARWEMGLLKPEEWSARWITAAKPVDARPLMEWGDWIWNAKAKEEKKKVFFRRHFKIDPGQRIARAFLKSTADDSHTVYINGIKIVSSGNWQEVSVCRVTLRVNPGDNVIAAEAVNQGGPAGLLVSLKVVLESGKTVEVKSDGEWLTSTEPINLWQTPKFNDTHWDKAMVVAAYGEGPWKGLKGPPGPRRSQCMRKEFNLKKKVTKARAYVSGLGLYELRINGQRVGKDIFTPGWTRYPKRIQYQTYDVTELLRKGGNAVGAMLGNGWWSGGLGWKSIGQYGDGNLRFILQLNVEYADGAKESIVTDKVWKVYPSPILEDTFYHGETYDARLEMPEWDAPGFDAGNWKDVVVLDEPVDTLVPQQSETIQITQELKPTQIFQSTPGVYVFDFGQNAVGWVRLKVKGKRGTKIRLRFAEILLPGSKLYRENLRSAEATDYYILKGEGEEIWEPRFTYHGFRYCEVVGYPGEPKEDDLTLCVVHSAAPEAGKFECSNWLINRIYENITWGQRSNMHSVPTDCPQRDERLGWMGDAQAFAPTACWNREMASFFSKWMHDITDSQDEKEGYVTDVAPVAVVTGPAKPGWGDAVVVVPWIIYQFYGDTRIIEENYEAMVAWVEYMRRNSKNHIYDRKGYGDWVPVVKSPAEPIGSAYYYYSTRLLSRMAGIIGKEKDADKYAQLADRIADAFHEKYFGMESFDAWYSSGTQTMCLLPLVFGITPRDHQKAVVGHIVEDIKARGNHLSTGFLGTAVLMGALTEYGYHDLAYALATQTTYPSWGYMVRNGATTVWERWDTDKQGPGMNSRNHFAFGAVGQWFFEALAGINVDPAHPGFKRIIIRPRPAGDLLWARASYPSMYGEIDSEWKRCEKALRLKISLPANTSAVVYVPTLGKGNITISEGSENVLRDGRQAARVAGVTLLRLEEDSAVFDVEAGQYEFVVRWN